ncbi:MAG TPA: hypothetical protein DCX95_02720 [Elusimicrobia bacterium]|nr:hypothetical protein [Elusimicrobiota bacterium]
MARLESVAKQGFYPTPETVSDIIAQYIQPTDKLFYALDPCCGEGIALKNLVSKIGTNGKGYGIEINSVRAKKSEAVLDKVINVDVSDIDCPKGAFSVMLLNPPYDTDGDGRRLEKIFLTATTKYLRTSGLLIFIIPQNQISCCSEYLSAHYKDIRTFQFPEKEYKSFGQVVIFGVKKDRVAFDNETERALNQISWGNDTLILTGAAKPLYIILPSLTKDFNFGSLSIKVESAINEADIIGLWKSGAFLQDLYGYAADNSTLRPLLPLKKGHLTLLIASGMFNNQILEKKGKRVIVKGRTYKVIDKNTDPSNEDVTTETDRFITEISVLNLKSGVMELVNNTPPADEQDE